MGGRAKIAMIGVRESHRTPWVGATGKETAAHVKGLGEGDVLRLLVDLGESEMPHIIALHEGVNSLLQAPLPSTWKRYLVDKNSYSAASATTVEVILGHG